MEAPVTGPTRASAADIPSLDRLLNASSFASLIERYGRTQVTSVLRAYLDTLRPPALSGALTQASLADDAIAAAVESMLIEASRPRMRQVFNLTGTVLHTNLGRAVLPEEAVRAVVQALTAPVNLEFDLSAGKRGDRDSLVDEFLCELTGAEAATVVNNNAAAVLLMLSTLAHRREVVISRGELIEIGGAFRMPDIMRQAGAKLVEVGTTNRTHPADYAQAVNPRTALLLKVHTSNYAISGFTGSVSVDELAELGRAHSIPVAVDLGSGSLVDLSRWHLPKEPTVRETVEGGADVVTFSGDKLLGGPQAGLVVGRRDLISKLKKHPLKRALRVGKLTLAALEAVLRIYRAPELLDDRLTALRLLTRAPAAMHAQATRLHPVVQRAVGNAYDVAPAQMFSQIGSGALPVDQLPSYGLRIMPIKGKRASVVRLSSALHALPRPVIGRIAEKALWLDLRCLENAEEAAFAAQLDDLHL